MSASEFDATKVFDGPASFEKVSVGRQALRRELNDRTSARHAIDSEFEVFCECGRASCRDGLVVSRDVYEKLRRVPTYFLIKHSHAGPSERIVESHANVLIIEKQPAPGSG
jgi:hypothetical protein